MPSGFLPVNPRLEALERRMWEDVRRDWDYADKIHVQQEDFGALKRVRLSPEELSPVLEALFRPEKRMFLDDIALIVAADEDVRRMIHLKYLDPENAVLSAFDGDGRLFGRIAVHADHLRLAPSAKTGRSAGIRPACGGVEGSGPLAAILIRQTRVGETAH